MKRKDLRRSLREAYVQIANANRIETEAKRMLGALDLGMIETRLRISAESCRCAIALVRLEMMRRSRKSARKRRI